MMNKQKYETQNPALVAYLMMHGIEPYGTLIPRTGYGKQTFVYTLDEKVSEIIQQFKYDRDIQEFLKCLRKTHERIRESYERSW